MRVQSFTLAAIALGTPAAASAAAVTPVTVFANAAPLQKIIMLAIVGAVAAGVAITALKLAAGPKLAGGSAFIAGLRFGAPIAGVLGGAFAIFRMAVGVANVSETPTLKMLAPGMAEAAGVVTLGFLAGVIAVALNWAIESRLDREVLRS